MRKLACKLVLTALCLTPIPVQAEQPDPDIDLDPVAEGSCAESAISPEGEAVFWTQENLSHLDQKIQMLQDQNAARIAPLSNSLSNSGDIILDTPRYTQETSYYCVPASVQILVEYVTGVKYSQSDLANAMSTSYPVGTYIDYAQPVVASLTGASYEIGNNQYSYFYNNMVADINADYPVIYWVNPSVFNNGSPDIGHAIVGNGYGNQGKVWFWDVNPSQAYDIWYCWDNEMSDALNALGGYYLF